MLPQLSARSAGVNNPTQCVYCQANPATIKCLTCYNNTKILKLCTECDKDIH